MSNNKEKPKDVKELPVAEKKPEQMLNDLEDLLSWMASPRVYWDNFAITMAIKNPKEIKWFALDVAEA
jgi:hypothetical protein